MIDSRGNVSWAGMFNRAHLEPELRHAYDALLACVLNGQKSCEVSLSVGMDAARSLMGLVRDDCPELIHLTGGMAVYQWRAAIELRPGYAKGYERSVSSLYTKLAKMERSAERLLAMVPAGASAFDRALALHDAYLAHYRYVKGRPYSHAAEGALLKHRAVCDGWAKGFKYLLDRAGIDCVYAHGPRRDGSAPGHGWCVVNLSDRIERPLWHVIDPCNDGRDGKAPLHSFFGLAEGELLYETDRSRGRWVPRATSNLGYYRLMGRYCATAESTVAIARGAGFPVHGVELKLPIFRSKDEFGQAVDVVLDCMKSALGCSVVCCMDSTHSVIRVDAEGSRGYRQAVRLCSDSLRHPV